MENNLKTVKRLLEIGCKAIGMKVEIKFTEDSDIEGEGNLGELWIDGLNIYPVKMVVERKGLVSSRVDVIGFQLDKSIVHRGVRTFRNGDPGYPDETDYTKVDQFQFAGGVASRAIQELVDNIIGNVFEAEGEAVADAERRKQEAEEYK